ncbi:foldase [Peptostreptococcus canis]|uniref:Foldase n=1 Tax=Peptostreptococcus canis TaxID=1159213 RepID=A0ABR6TLQ4_9FIRM|nr:foldase [Peptostreptococcus canis]
MEERILKKLLSLLVAVVIGFASVACSEDAVAVVDGKAITAKEYEQHLKFNKWVMELQYGEQVWDGMSQQDPNFEENIKNRLLESLIQSKIVLNYTEKNNIKPDTKQSKEINEQIKKMMEDKKSKESFEKAGLTEDFLKKYGEQAALMSGFSKFVEKKSTPTEQELKDYYAKNSKKLDASHILISLKDETGKPLSEEKQKEAKKKAEDVYKRAKDGEDFAKLAKEFSQDPGSGQKGGSLGEFGKGQMVKEFEDAAFALKEGEISAPVKSEFGYHIIKVNKIIKSDYNKVKDSLKAELTQKKSQELVKKIQESAQVKKFDDKVKSIKFIEKKADSKDKKDTNKGKEKEQPKEEKKEQK